MTTHHHVPSEDSVSSIDELVACAHDVECTCAERGLPLHPPAHPLSHEPAAVVIDEDAVHRLDGYPDYGD